MKSHHKNQIRRGNGAEFSEDDQLPRIGLDNVPPLTIEELSDTYGRMTDAGWETDKSMGEFVLDALQREYEILKEDARRSSH
ncbi:MAG TPA: hypothetical protein VFW52_01615 [Candidatus Saccharimonadales bacterium]|nr:hypothetical protein [Candidatus Saccharimonadales bacterium]